MDNVVTFANWDQELKSLSSLLATLPGRTLVAAAYFLKILHTTTRLAKEVKVKDKNS